MKKTSPAKNKKRLRKLLGAIFFDSDTGELRKWLKPFTILALAAFSLWFVAFIKKLACDAHQIEYVGIALADITAGATLFMILEQRIAGKETKFTDERNLRFTANRLVMLLIALAKERAATRLRPELDEKKMDSLISEIREISSEPDLWRFYGSERIYSAVDELLREGKIADGALELVKKTLELSSTRLENRIKISKSMLFRQRDIAELKPIFEQIDMLQNVYVKK